MESSWRHAKASISQYCLKSFTQITWPNTLYKSDDQDIMTHYWDFVRFIDLVAIIMLDFIKSDIHIKKFLIKNENYSINMYIDTKKDLVYLDSKIKTKTIEIIGFTYRQKKKKIKITDFKINVSSCKNPSLINKSSLKNLLYPQHSPISKSDVNSLNTPAGPDVSSKNTDKYLSLTIPLPLGYTLSLQLTPLQPIGRE
ncbi:hypothetical protein AGLY_005550 [Aphis glycines]|uniref:Uncharacterized protein n=1 Tax=Aphis glycines TaxID=307491 RepID=A0A6G0TU13_APHGL|nr:hypothetical protein AGLY_005550 [Aphis glycines]